METIWANRLIAGTKDWDDVPESRKDGVKAELEARVEMGRLTEEKYCKILGIELPQPEEGEDQEGVNE